MKKDGRVLAQQNQIRILRALHRFGWLRTRDLASLVWLPWSTSQPQLVPSLRAPIATPSNIRMAQRTLLRLKKGKLVLSHQAPDGSLIYGLAESGARALRDMGIPAKSAKDLVRSFSQQHFRHRCISNEIAISAILQGYHVSTERETATGLWIGGMKGIGGKKPDVLIRQGRQAYWVEVERSRKNRRDYEKLLAWLKAILANTYPQLSENLELRQVVFICTHAFQTRLERDLHSIGLSKETITSRIFFGISLYSFEAIAFSSI